MNEVRCAAILVCIHAGHSKFFMGSDSAPHPRHTKETSCAHAGVYTAPLLMPYVVTTLTRLGASNDAIKKFTAENGVLGSLVHF
jgi:dihydroorotase